MVESTVEDVTRRDDESSASPGQGDDVDTNDLLGKEDGFYLGNQSESKVVENHIQPY